MEPKPPFMPDHLVVRGVDREQAERILASHTIALPADSELEMIQGMWYCNIHAEEFDHDEHGGCPSCIEEWESPDMRDLTQDPTVHPATQDTDESQEE